MVNKFYQKIISMSLEKYIWFFIIGTSLSFLSGIIILMLIVNYILKVESDESSFRVISMDPSQTIFYISISLVILILWTLIKINLKQQNKSASLFLQSLFKVILIINVFLMVLYISNILYTYLLYREFKYEDLLLVVLPEFAWSLLIITFLFIVVKSYSKIISYKKLLVFEITAIVILIINVIIKIVRLIQYFKIFLYMDDLSYYFHLDNIISTVISMLMSIIWILWINKFVSVHKSITTSNEVLLFDKEESSVFNNNQSNLNNSLRKYGIIAIVASAITLRLAVIIYQIIRLINNQHAIINTNETIQTLLALLTHPSITVIFVEVIIYLWIAILILFTSRKHTLTPFITLFILYFHTLFQSIFMYIFLRVRYIDRASNINNYTNLYIQLIIPFLGYMVFIGILIWRYRKFIKPTIVKIGCIGFVVTLIASLIYSIFNQQSLNFNMSLELINLPDMNTIKIVVSIINVIIFVFWILFAIFYCREVCLDNDGE